MYYPFSHYKGWSTKFTSKMGHVEVVDMLLQHGAKVDLTDKVCLISEQETIGMCVHVCMLVCWKLLSNRHD